MSRYIHLHVALPCRSEISTICYQQQHDVQMHQGQPQCLSLYYDRCHVNKNICRDCPDHLEEEMWLRMSDLTGNKDQGHMQAWVECRQYQQLQQMPPQH